MTTIQKWLRWCATDWNGEQMPDGEPAKGDPTAGELREAADIIDALSAGTAEMLNIMVNQQQADIKELMVALNGTILQIEYLHVKFQETGSGNAQLLLAREVLAKHKGYLNDE